MARAHLGGVRTNIYLPKPQHAAVTTLVGATGITFAEHIRRAVDFYLAFSDDITQVVTKLAEQSDPPEGETQP